MLEVNTTQKEAHANNSNLEFEFKMPALGADMEQGTLATWHVKVGDSVKRGDIIADIDTDKGTIEVEIWEAGKITSLVVQPGQTVPVGAVLAKLETTTTPAVAKSDLRVSPLARSLAQEYHVDLGLVHGTGPQGAITKSDVVDYAATLTKQDAADPLQADENRRLAMRQAIAASMSRSKREIPHYYLQTDANMTAALSYLEKKNANLPLKSRIILTPLLLKAVGHACLEYPEMSGYWTGDAFHPAAVPQVGIAIALRGGGLVAPALRDIVAKPLEQVMVELLDLVNRVRAGKIRSSELTAATITVTHLGDQGVESVFGVIYPPQVALIGFGKVSDKPYASGSLLGVAPQMTITLSADHRSSDGHQGARFLKQIVRFLENPAMLEEVSSGQK